MSPLSPTPALRPISATHSPALIETASNSLGWGEACNLVGEGG